MNTADILAWHDWFITIAQAGATLAGLLFVGLTISLDHVLSARGYLSRAFTALALQFEILLIGIFGLIPGQPATALGVEFVIVGAAILAGTSIFARNFPEDEGSHVLGGTGPRVVRMVLTGIATLTPVVAGASLINRWPGALYWLVPAIVASAYLSIGYAWIFAIEIPRRMAEKKKVRGG